MTHASGNPDRPADIAATPGSAGVGHGVMLCLVALAAVWLGLGLGVRLVAGWKFFAPDALAQWPALGYGRLQPLSNFLLLYGFATPAGLAVCSWLWERQSGAAGSHSWWRAVGIMFWNAGMVTGAWGILAGDLSDMSWYPMPRPASLLLTLGVWCLAWPLMQSFLVTAIPRRAAAPSLGFAGLLWLVCSLTMAQVLVDNQVLRGTMTAVLDVWLGGAMLYSWLGVVCLAAMLALVEEKTGGADVEPWAAFSVLVLWQWCGPLCHFTPGLPLPRWMAAASSACQWLSVAALVLFTVQMVKMAGEHLRLWKSDAGLQLAACGLLAWGEALLLNWVLSRPALAGVAEFSLLRELPGVLLLAGFILPLLTAILMAALPGWTGQAYPGGWLSRLHVFGTVAGLILVAGALLVGGLAQGLAESSPDQPFLSAARQARTGLAVAAVGWWIYAAGQLAFLTSLGRLLWRWGWRRLATLTTLPAPGEKIRP